MKKPSLDIIAATFLLLAVTLQGCGDPASNPTDRGSQHGEPPVFHGPMMGGQCPMCGGPWQGGDITIPDKLPKPNSEQWISRLNEVLSLEKLSRAQYKADEEKYEVRMPYAVIIPQEENHIKWIGELFGAYGIKSSAKAPSVKKSTSIRQAYEIGRNLESELIPKYVWLIQNGEDTTTKQVLNSILFQTRMHHMMFTHALEMSGMGMMH